VPRITLRDVENVRVERSEPLPDTSLARVDERSL
jgi:hypothetical protein